MVYKKLEYDGLKTVIDSIKRYSLKMYKFNSDPLLYYKYLMKEFFEKRGSKTATPEQLTAICDEWYMKSRNKWDGYTKFYHPDLSAVSTGIKGGDNFGMICEPSTNTYKGRDDYAGNPLFAVTDCNWEMTDDGEPLITSIEGIMCSEPFTRNDPDKFVGVLQMTGYHWWTELDLTNSNSYYEGYCSNYSVKPYNTFHIEALPEAVIHEDVDVRGRVLLESISNGSRCNVRSWVLHSKYMSDLTSNNTMTSYSGGPTRTYVFSHNSSHTYANNTSNIHNQISTYSGSTICDNAFLILMMRIKYASLTMDNIIQGSCKYNFQYAAVVSETNVKRVIISAANAENIIIGSTMLVGTGTDRESAAYSISGQSGYVVTGKVPVGSNIAIMFNNAPNTFNVTTSTYITTSSWHTGSCDNILGNDGSPYDYTNKKEPAKLQGIEYMMGAYETFSDVLIKVYQENSKYLYQPYLVRKVSQQAESITSNYIASNIIIQSNAGGWGYIVYMTYKNGIYFTTRIGGSSTTYTRDGIYFIASPSATIYQWLAYDWNGAGDYYCGINFLYPNTITTAYTISTRLSCNGNRGVYNH